MADLRAFYAEPNSIKKDEIAARQLRALRDYGGPRERKLRLSDVKDMFEQMRDHVGPASGNFICAACPQCPIGRKLLTTG